MIRQDIKKCIKRNHEYLFYLNTNVEINVEPRCIQIQKKIINKLLITAQKLIHENSPKGVIECMGCHTYLKAMIKYLTSIEWDIPEVRYEVEQFIHNITLTTDRKYVKQRVKIRTNFKEDK